MKEVSSFILGVVDLSTFGDGNVIGFCGGGSVFLDIPGSFMGLKGSGVVVWELIGVGVQCSGCLCSILSPPQFSV